MSNISRQADSTLFGDIRVILLGSFFIVFIISLFLPEYAAWIVKRTFDLFYVVIHFLGGILIGIVWIFLKFLELLGIFSGADVWRTEVANNLGSLLNIITLITYDLVDAVFIFEKALNPIDDGINFNNPPNDNCNIFLRVCE